MQAGSVRSARTGSGRAISRDNGGKGHLRLDRMTPPADRLRLRRPGEPSQRVRSTLPPSDSGSEKDAPHERLGLVAQASASRKTSCTSLCTVVAALGRNPSGPGQSHGRPPLSLADRHRRRCGTGRPARRGRVPRHRGPGDGSPAGDRHGGRPDAMPGIFLGKASRSKTDDLGDEAFRILVGGDRVDIAGQGLRGSLTASTLSSRTSSACGSSRPT